LATLSIISNQIINPNPAFDLTRDLAPIALLSSGAVVLVVNPELNIHSVAELIALAKSKPGEVMHATVMGSLPHLASELFALRAGIQADASALSRQPADNRRCHRRACHDHVLAGFDRGRPDCSRPTQGAGGSSTQALQCASRRAYDDGSRATRF